MATSNRRDLEIVAPPGTRRPTPIYLPAVRSELHRMGIEKRESPRVDLEVAVALESDNNFYTGLTQDIGGGGLFVVTDELRRVGERIVLSFTLPASRTPIVAETVVRWVRQPPTSEDGMPAGVGLRFIRLDPQAQQAIQRFIQARDPLFYDE